MQQSMQGYEYNQLKKDLMQLTNKYDFLEKISIGKTVTGKELYCVTLGNGKRKVHVNAAHHGNEWITSMVLIKYIELLSEMKVNDNCNVYSEINEIIKNTTYDFIPMVNPDGVEIAIRGLKGQKEKKFLYETNEKSEDFRRWRANSRGVDLNRNYPAGFEACQKLSGLKTPSYGYYQGEYAMCEEETKALVNFTYKRQYDLVLAYHTQGEEIYWNYNNVFVENAEEYAQAFAKASGYQLGQPEGNAIAGGYKDWFIETFKKPGFTIECGVGTNPLEISQVKTIVQKTLPILLLAGKEHII